MTIRIHVNGKTESLHEPLPLSEYLRGKDLDPDSVVVEHNREIIARETYPEILLQEDDHLEILRFVGGG